MVFLDGAGLEQRRLETEVTELWLVVDAEADMATLRRVADKPMHEYLGTGQATQVFELWAALEDRHTPVTIHVVKQESHRCSTGNHKADAEAGRVIKTGEPVWRSPPTSEHLHLVLVPPKAERGMWVHGGERRKGDIRTYPQPVHMLAHQRGGPRMQWVDEYLRGKAGVSSIRYPNPLKPEDLPKHLQARGLQALTGQVPVRDTVLRWYRHLEIAVSEEYGMCHCGQARETYEHFLGCQEYAHIKGGLHMQMVQAADVRWRKRGEKGVAAAERAMGAHRRALFHMVVSSDMWATLTAHYAAPEDMARRLLRRAVEHLHERMQYRAEMLDARLERLACARTRAVEGKVIRYRRLLRLDAVGEPDWTEKREGTGHGGASQAPPLKRRKVRRIRRVQE